MINILIALIFASLSIVVILFTAIYLNKTNKKNNISQKKIKRKDIKKLWEIDDIKEGVIISENNNTMVMRIGSIDYHLLSEFEQNALENSLEEISKTIKYPVQFFSTTEFIDTSAVTQNIRNSINNKNNIKLIKYGQAIIEHLDKIMENHNLYVRKNYVLVSYVGDFEKAKNELNSIYENLRFNLLNAKISLERLNDIEILELIHRELNKNTTTKIESLLEKGGLELYVTGKNRFEEIKKKETKERKKFI